MKQTVVIGISSGIAAFKILDLIRSLRGKEIEVRVVMTNHATHMIDPAEVETASGHPVLTALYPPTFDYKQVLKERSVDHIDLADRADLFVVAPATANTVAKLAHGIADDVLTTTALAVTAHTMIVPSMNVNMWSNPAVQENVRVLRSRGMIVIEPDDGPLACGYTGKGRLPDIAAIETEIVKLLSRSTKLKGKRVLVTAGGTSEPIDGVRAITNNSSGKMGVALAEAAYLAGAEVTLLRSHTSVMPRYPMTIKSFVTAADLLSHIKGELPRTDICFHVAAVADFRVAPSPGKLSSEKSHQIKLVPQPKILDQIKKINPSVYVIGFKAEPESDSAVLIQKAQSRLQESQIDAIVANQVGMLDRGFQSDTNEAWIITKDKAVFHIPLSTKTIVAEKILENLF